MYTFLIHMSSCTRRDVDLIRKFTVRKGETPLPFSIYHFTGVLGNEFDWLETREGGFVLIFYLDPVRII